MKEKTKEILFTIVCVVGTCIVLALATMQIINYDEHRQQSPPDPVSSVDLKPIVQTISNDLPPQVPGACLVEPLEKIALEIVPEVPPVQPPQYTNAPTLPAVVPLPYVEPDRPEVLNINERSCCAGGRCSTGSNGWYFGKRLKRLGRWR
jgi:hypothetical protein